MADRRGARQRQTRHDREDRGEGHRRNEAQEQVAAHGVGQMDRRHVGAAADRRQTLGGVGQIVRIGGDQRDRAEADDEGQDVEIADEASSVEHRLAGGLRVRDREEAHQDVRQAGRAEHQREAERHRRNRVRDEPARRHDRFLLGMDGDRGLEQAVEAEAELHQHHQRHEAGARQQQDRLDDLHPRRGDHAAEGDVDDHQEADDHDRDPVVEAEQQLDQLAGADHLRDQVEGDDDQRAAGRQNADRGLTEAERGDVGEGELAEVAQRLRDQEGHDRPADEKADRIDQTVIARRVDEAGNAEERGGRHVVARDRQAVLEAGDAAASGIELRGGLGLLGGPVGDAERQQHEGDEHRDRGNVDRLLGGGTRDRVGERGRGEGGERGRRGDSLQARHYLLSSTIWRVSSS